ncbi:MAG: hypothetical protein RR547_00045, partial [Raoultibacter sp.]
KGKKPLELLRESYWLKDTSLLHFSSMSSARGKDILHPSEKNHHDAERLSKKPLKKVIAFLLY